MFKLLKNGECFVPESIGKKDILIVCGQICRIEDDIEPGNLWNVEVIDCSGMLVCPGFIDQHVHITGGGGEEGPISRIPELMLGEIVAAGVSTVVGVLGVDFVTRNISTLLAKARALELEGITTYIYTGSYSVPTATLTGKVISDIALIDKVIGVGEIAIADYRSSHATAQLLKEVAFEAKVGGMLGGKAGVMHMHVGDGKQGLDSLYKLVDESDFPIDMFVPTHLNRNKSLFPQALDYSRRGGYLDFTAGESSETGYSVPDMMQLLIQNEVNMDKVTVSSDANGSVPSQEGSSDGVGKVKQLFDDIRECIVVRRLDIETILRTVTSNVANILKIFPKKGALRIGSDADILVLNKDSFDINTMLVKGEIFVENGKVIKKGRYER